jgi:pimeloyl-ACP methyl ester carboxylesterase/DNA-binding CsgD family transcriptional regulator
MRSPVPTRYANSDGVHIAYQVLGAGPIDLIFVPGWVSHVEYHWEEPRLAYFLHRLAGFSRLIVLDKRGTGLSDRVTPLPDLERRMDDVRAVQDAVGSERAVLFGYSEGGSMCQLFAASYPARTLALITYGCWAKRLQSPDYPWGPTLEERQRFYDFIVANWGGVVDLADLAPSVANDPQFCEWFAAYLRHSASPGAALALAQMNAHIDLRPVLSSIHVPTLIIHRRDDRDACVEGARYLAEHIQGSKLLELPGADHLPWVSDADSVLDAIESFLKGLNLLRAPSPSLAAVLAVRWTGEPHRIAAWRRAAMTLVAEDGGEGIDGAPAASLLAVFSGAVRAIRCARVLKGSAEAAGCSARIGIHAGDCRHEAEAWHGPALTLAREISACAHAGEILVSRQVKDLTTGSGVPFIDPPPRSSDAVEGLELFLVEPLTSPAVPRSVSAAAGRSVGLNPKPLGLKLTRQQQRILDLVAQGKSNKEIARLMRRSEHTIHRHMANIFNRLNVVTRAAAVAKGATGVSLKDGPNG